MGGHLLDAALFDADGRLAELRGVVLVDEVCARCEALGSPSAGSPGLAIGIAVHLSEDGQELIS